MILSVAAIEVCGVLVPRPQFTLRQICRSRNKEPGFGVGRAPQAAAQERSSYCTSSGEITMEMTHQRQDTAPRRLGLQREFWRRGRGGEGGGERERGTHAHTHARTHAHTARTRTYAHAHTHTHTHTHSTHTHGMHTQHARAYTDTQSHPHTPSGEWRERETMVMIRDMILS